MSHTLDAKNAKDLCHQLVCHDKGTKDPPPASTALIKNSAINIFLKHVLLNMPNKRFRFKSKIKTAALTKIQTYHRLHGTLQRNKHHQPSAYDPGKKYLVHLVLMRLKNTVLDKNLRAESVFHKPSNPAMMQKKAVQRQELFAIIKVRVADKKEK